MKPYADLPQIYRNFMEQIERSEELEEGRQLLNNLAKILEAEKDGAFHLLEKEDLAMYLVANGAVRPRTYSTFSGQAHIVTAEKPSKAY